MNYFRNLSHGMIILWCYLIWYTYVLIRYFDPTPSIWLTSLGLSLIVGFALTINAAPTKEKLQAMDKAQIFRFFLAPFCVSSFSALVKGKDFFLIFSPHLDEVLTAIALCIAFCGFVFAWKRLGRSK